MTTSPPATMMGFSLMFHAALLLSGCVPQQAAVSQPSPPPPPIEFAGAWGTPGDGPGQLSRPAGMATDAVGNVYISDAGSRFVHKFDAAGTPLFSFTDTLLQQPGAIAVDRGKAIYVFDARYDALFVFLPNGDRLRRLRGAGGAVFRGPTDVAVDSDGIVYTAEPAGKRIRAFNPRGQLRRVFRPEAHDNGGTSTAPDRLSAAPDGILYATAPDGRVHVFPPRGASTSWEMDPPPGSAASAGGKPAVDGVAVTGKAVFTVAPACREVQAWSHSGALLHTATIPAPGTATVATSSGDAAPGGCRLAATPNELFVLDAVRRRVVRFRLNF